MKKIQRNIGSPVKNHCGLISVEIAGPMQWNPLEFIMISRWESEKDIAAHAGENLNQAYIPKGMEAYIEKCSVSHFDNIEGSRALNLFFLIKNRCVLYTSFLTGVPPGNPFSSMHHGYSSVITPINKTMHTTKISVQTTIAADLNKVWEYYTEPEHITKWNFASDDWCCPMAKNDLRPGGKYTARMEAKDGSFGFDFEATYDDVKPAESFTYTKADGRRAIVKFGGLGNKTNLLVRFDPENENPIDRQRNGWQAILDNFKKYTEQS
ncbi:MAG TPA: SRPBCC family protein [Eudoraea sp.]|nr:SRPBCC family protein [Eudoraea sp.]